MTVEMEVKKEKAVWAQGGIYGRGSYRRKVFGKYPTFQREERG